MALQKLISKLEKEKNLDKARKKKEAALKKRKYESTDIVSLKKEIVREKNPDEVIHVGDHVRMIDGDMSGEVLNIKGNKAQVLFGLMKVQVPVADITLTNEHLKFNQNKRVNFSGVERSGAFDTKLDIRGYKFEDANHTLDEFFDKAILHNVRSVEIVHGKGKGALRRLVLSKIKEYKDLQSYYHPEDEYGGDGVTVIKL